MSRVTTPSLLIITSSEEKLQILARGCQAETPGQTGVAGGGGGGEAPHHTGCTVTVSVYSSQWPVHCIYHTQPHHCSDQPSIAIIVMRMLILSQHHQTHRFHFSLQDQSTSKEDFKGTK